MGIHDRDYIRDREPPGPGGPRLTLHPRGLSVVTWLIIINFAVFLVDGMLATSGVYIAVPIGNNYYEAVDPDQPQRVLQQATRNPATGRLEYPIVSTETGQIIGVRVTREMPPFTAIGHFSTIKAFTHIEIWRFVTFQFLHADMTHILFNMIGLFFFGPIAERYLGGRLFLAFYLVCGVFGAALYLMLNLLGYLLPAMPGLLMNAPDVPLVGASAGVFGVLMAAAYVARDAVMLFMLVIPMRVSTGAYLFVALAAINLLTHGANAGGDAAHLGGAAAGFYFIRKPHHLLDFFDDFLGSSKKRAAVRGRTPRKSRHDKRVDAILDKVSREGMHALSDAERRILAQASEDRRR